jgi:hypothetical protein
MATAVERRLEAGADSGVGNNGDGSKAGARADGGGDGDSG